VSTSMNTMLVPGRDTRTLLIKWIVALLVPIVVFTFIWSGEAIINNVLLGLINPGSTPYDTPTLIAAAVFIVIFYVAVIALAGYLVAADSGRHGMVALWIDVLIFAVVPLLLVMSLGLIIGLALCAIVWPIYL
jgi:CDP-diglyceride synthetase